MIKKLSDGRTLLIGQQKGDKTVKLAYTLKKDTWKLSFKGDFSGLTEWIKHQHKLADKAETRQLIADMCGTSYAAACRDMGGIK